MRENIFMAHPTKYPHLAPLVKEMRHYGTLNEIGAQLEVSGAWIREIIKKAERDLSLPDWTLGLDVRTTRALLAAGFTSKDDLRAAISAGKHINRVANKRLAVVIDWLNLNNS